MSLPPRNLGYDDLYQLPLYRSPRPLAKIVTAAFLVYAAGIVASYVLLWDALGVAQQMAGATEVSEVALNEIDRRAGQLDLISVGLTVVMAIAFCFWTHRVATNARAFGAHTTISPGWAVGYHFIPILNLWRPYSALSEVWNGSAPDLRDGQVRLETSGLMLTWWIVWLISGIGSAVLMRDEVDTAEQWMTSIKLAGVALAIETVALVLAILVVWSLTRRQEGRAATLPPAHVRG